MRIFPVFITIVLVFSIFLASGCLNSSGDAVSEFSGDAEAVADNTIYAAYFSNIDKVEQTLQTCGSEIATEFYNTGAFDTYDQAFVTMQSIFGCESVFQKQVIDQGDRVFVVRYLQQTVASCQTYSTFYCDVSVDIGTNEHSADCSNNAIFSTDYHEKISNIASIEDCAGFADAYVTFLVRSDTGSVSEWDPQ